MNPTWQSEEPPEMPQIDAAGWVRALLRGIVLGVVVYGGLAVFLLIRLFEWPFGRPVTPWITQGVCKASFAILGIGFRWRGRPMTARGAVVANHASWLDIFALNAAQRIFFVSKAEVRGWPGIGPLARATGTVFIERDRRHASAQKTIFEDRLRRGDKLLFFPEGTSTDSTRVLPFKSTLFQAFFAPEIVEFMHVQPVTVVYHAPRGADPRFYGWWGDMDFGRHLLKVLAAPLQGEVEVVFHTPVRVAEFPHRKALTLYCEARVREGMDLE
ncbi:1-acyl-sn-glycerol-3-phosphate acyltransferase [Maritimibacter sp. 55A14]|uniref:lysophospholipid acyltransferase family protein n=1 Tax=Maritimibacter sp. 55A14 TaxID=2174844 RepID=UPI000D60CB8E|nr:lysophospholipid acyltransferase family protein [Maritimibacter sp. 55A14]PWE33060.1 1-acyl-sn-glycerol-3-phosphate acyltransferase [Maritimibacter sp. 55A14]